MPAVAMTALGRLPEAGTSLIVADISWKCLTEQVTTGSGRLFRDLPDAQEVTVPAEPGPDDGAANDSPLRQRLSAATAQEQEGILLELIRAHAADVLGHESPEAIDPQDNFIELGFSSFTALEMNKRLTAVTGYQIPAVAVYEHPTPVTLAHYLRTELAGGNEPDSADGVRLTEQS